MKKYIIVFLALLLLLASGFSINLYKKQKALSAEMELKNDKLQLAEKKVSTLELKSYADDVFIAGKYGEAIEIYKKLEVQDKDDKFPGICNLRIAYKDAQEKQKNNFIITERAYESKIKQAELVNMALQNQVLAETSLHKENVDSMNTVVALLEQEIDKNRKALKEISGRDKVVFVNSKNNRVVYFGDVKNGKANGKGTAVWNTGSMYEGKWKNNNRHGQGTFEWADGEKYTGTYKDDKREGEGTYFWKNGEKYVGSWKEDKRNGNGIIYSANGNIKVQGEWKNDELVNSRTSMQ